MVSKLSYCGEMVRRHDPDRFLLSLFVPAKYREDLWALFAFNHEIAKTREVVSETQLGLIRLQWWRDAVEKMYAGDPPSPDGYGATGVLEHEVVKPLADVIERRGLSREHFDALIYAREFDLEDVMPTHLEGTVAYADYTGTPLLKLVVEIMEGSSGADSVHTIAVNYGIAGLLRAVPFHAAQKRCYLPEALLQENRVRRLYDLKPEGDLKAVIQRVSGVFAADVRAENRFLRACQGLAEIYMKQLKTCQYDVFDPKMRLSPAFKELRLWLKTIF